MEQREQRVARIDAIIENGSTAEGGGDVFDGDDFNAVDTINRMFPTEDSMEGVGDLVHKLKHKVQRVDAEILAAVRHQSTSGTRARSDLTDAMTAIQELFSKIRDIKRKAEQSEVMVQEICRDIKKLDYAKKHLTTTITALRRLSMLVSAVEQLEVTAEKREYKGAANLVEAVNQLSTHFAAYGQIPRIAELRGRFTSIKANLRTRIFDDFRALATVQAEDGTLNVEVMAQLADACLVVDVLEPHVKDELVGNVCNVELSAYSNIFSSTGEMAKLEATERRYAYIKRQLKAKEEQWQIFPATWRVPQLLCVTLCKITRAQLAEVLDAQGSSPDVAALLQALQRTLEFEKELAERFSTGEEDEGGPDGVVEDEEGDSAPASSVRKRYERILTMERKRAGTEAGTSGRSALGMENAAQAAARTNFRGSISSCFEPHLRVYVELEEKSLLERVDALVAEETWAAEAGGDGAAVLGSASQVFLHIKRSLSRCSALTRNQTLFDLYCVFQHVLRAYARKLAARVPSPAADGAVATVTGTDWHVRLAPGEEAVVALVVNTAQYCAETTIALGESVARTLDAPLAGRVDTEGEEEAFSDVASKAFTALVLGVETRLDVGLAAMAKVNWGQVETVGDQSDYVGQMNAALAGSVAEAGAVLGADNFRFFCDKLAASFVPRLYDAVLRTRRICEEGAQQLLLDVSSIKAFLLEAPAMGGPQHAATSSYSRSVQGGMGRTENLLKVVLSPAAGVADAYRGLMGEDAPAADFQRVLEIKGLKKGEQAALVEGLSASRGAGAGGAPGALAGGAPTLGGAAGAPPWDAQGTLSDRVRGGLASINVPRVNMPQVNMPFTGRGAAREMASSMASSISDLRQDGKNTLKRLFN